MNQGKSTADLEIAGFWPRVGALTIDGLVLGIGGVLAGTLFFDQFARLGFYGRLLGFAIALAYFGICNSRLAGGQTPGKMVLGLRVVNAQGDLLSLPRSLVRYLVLGIPFFANGLPLSPAKMMSPLAYLLVFLVFGGLLSIAYLYIFNRRTRQSLHDLLVGSYVVRAEPTEPKPLLVIWRGHLVVVGMVAVLCLAAPTVASRLSQSATFAGLMPAYEQLLAQPHVSNATVVRGKSWVNGNTTHYTASQLWLDASMIDDATLAANAAHVLASHDPDFATEDTVVVQLTYGYDIGIARGWRTHSYSFKPAELQ